LVDTLQHAETVASGTGTAPAKAVASGTETAPAKAVAHGTETAPAKAVAHGTETHGTETASATAGATAPERLTLHINFDKDKATIRQEDAAELQKVIDFAKQHPGGRITIEGYTDSTGSPEYNQSLSERRAAAAKDYLAKNGAPGNEQITIVGYGESKPIASNSTAEGRAENRRVDIAALQ
ncbi:MAG TPA: OmpA family protein, partial [Candidatus Sulfotelmatobacter sp.]|nr:OmpA family protein [Candidatus Sulfotelmatobacter sp.]